MALGRSKSNVKSRVGRFISRSMRDRRITLHQYTKYANIKIFKMAIIRHFEFSKFESKFVPIDRDYCRILLYYTKC